MNIMELLQAYQQAQKAPTMMGPVLPQNPQPGFRAPPPMGLAPPPAQQQGGFGLGDGMGMLSAGLGALKHDPTKPGVPTPQGDPTGGAGPAYLGGVSPLGNINQPVNPSVLNSGGGLLGFFRGLF